MDACVLIDFLHADRTVLHLIPEYVGEVYVISQVVEELREINETSELYELGLLVIDPEIEDIYSAASEVNSISFQDRLCLLTAKRHGLTCITNDRILRRFCETDGVPILWGLELLVELCDAGGIPKNIAEAIAQTIHETNPRHITQKILKKFKEKLSNIK